MSRQLWCAVAALVVLCGPGLAHAEDVKVGVVVTTFVNLTDQEADDVGAVLARVVNDQLQASATGGADVRSRVGQVPEDCSEKQVCLQSLGKKLAVQQLLLLVVVRVGERRQISCTWADVSTGKAETRAPVTLQSGDNIHQVFGAIVTELLPGVKARGGKAEPVATTKPSPPTGDPDDPFIEDLDQPDKKPGGRKLTTPVFIAGGAAIGLLSIGTVGSVLASKRLGQYEDACGNIEEQDWNELNGCEHLYDRSKTINVFADVFWAGGLIAGGVATYFYLTSADDDSPPAVTVGPTRDGGIGVSYGGRF